MVHRGRASHLRGTQCAAPSQSPCPHAAVLVAPCDPNAAGPILPRCRAPLCAALVLLAGTGGGDAPPDPTPEAAPSLEAMPRDLLGATTIAFHRQSTSASVSTSLHVVRGAAGSVSS